jgi:hypothetical protein
MDVGASSLSKAIKSVINGLQSMLLLVLDPDNKRRAVEFFPGHYLVLGHWQSVGILIMHESSTMNPTMVVRIYDGRLVDRCLHMRGRNV